MTALYVWMVDEIESADLSKLKNLSRGNAQMEEYDLFFRTMPDHVILTFVPGLVSADMSIPITGPWPN